MRSRKTVAVLGVLIVGGCASGPGAPRPSVSMFDSPTSAALSWFAAVNQKDRQASLAHFEAGSAGMADWSGGPSAWPVFSSLQCKDESVTSGDARVTCTFEESDAPAVGNPETWCDVYLHRHDDGRWLIYSYGQG